MGLSSKQVSVGGLNWRGQSLLQSGGLIDLPNPPQPQVIRQQHQQSAPLKCPRCDSTNTKFCYYNNYNKSQPRHFCKTCRRHWTKGGTLRNVPVGGGRKNKLLKTSSFSSSSNTNINTNTTVGNNLTSVNRNLGAGAINLGSSSTRELEFLSSKLHHGIKAELPVTPHPTFPFTSLSSLSFSDNPSSSMSSLNGAFPHPSPNLYGYPGKVGSAYDPIHTTTFTTTALPWQTPSTASLMDSFQYWNWDDDYLTAIVTTDLGQPWSDGEQLRPEVCGT